VICHYVVVLLRHFTLYDIYICMMLSFNYYWYHHNGKKKCLLELYACPEISVLHKHSLILFLWLCLVADLLFNGADYLWTFSLSIFRYLLYISLINYKFCCWFKILPTWHRVLCFICEWISWLFVQFYGEDIVQHGFI
jgi:hypothetical protein